MNKIFLILIAICSTFVATAQQSLSVDQYREMVLEYSQTIKESKEGVSGYTSDIKAAKTNLYPQLDASGEYSYLINKINYDFAGIELAIAQNNYGISAVAAQNVYSGGIVRKQIKALEIGKEISESSVEFAVENVSYAADVSYWRLAAMDSFREATQEYLEIIKQTYDIVLKRYEDGLIAKTDLLMIETRLKEAEFKVSDIDKQYQDANISLNILMGMPPETRVILSDSLLNRHFSLPQFEDLSIALENRADFAIVEKQVEAQLQAVKIAKADYLPKIAVGVTGQYATPLINFTGEGMTNIVAFAKVSVPIFRWNQKSYVLASGNSKVRASEYKRQTTIDNISQELSSAWANLENTYNQLEIVEQTLGIAEQSLDLNNFSYEQGILSIVDVLSSQISWLNAYNSVISTYFSYMTAEAAYKKAKGEF